MLNFPAGVVPITKVTSKDLELTNDYPVIDESHRVIKEVKLKGRISFIIIIYVHNLSLGSTHSLTL